MAERILVIGKGASQQLSADIMSHFQQVKMVVGGGQNSMPLEMVSQLLFLQSQCNLKIDFLQFQTNTDEEYNRILSFQLGLFLMDPENEVALLSNDPSIDPVVEYAKNLGYRLQRMESTGAIKPQGAPAAMKPAPQPMPQPQVAQAPQPQVAQPAQPAAPKSTNKKLISTLIGGSSGLMGG